jgi:hypothetical protein
LVGDEAEAWRRPSASVKEAATSRKKPSRFWRPLLREVDEDDDDDAAVLFCYSARRAAVHGDGGGRRNLR